MFPAMVALSLALIPVPQRQMYVKALVVLADSKFASRVGWVKPGACVTELPENGCSSVYPVHDRGKPKAEGRVTVHGTWSGDINPAIRAAEAAEKIDYVSRPHLLIAGRQPEYFNLIQSAWACVNCGASPTGARTTAGQAATFNIAVECLKNTPHEVIPPGGPGFFVGVVPQLAPCGTQVQMRVEGKSVLNASYWSMSQPAFEVFAAEGNVSVAPGKTACLCIGQPFGYPTVLLAFVSADVVAEPVPAVLGTANRVAAAMRLAVKALALDPSCFK